MMQQSKRIFILASLLLTVHFSCVQAVAMCRAHCTHYKLTEDAGQIDKKESAYLLFKSGESAYRKGQYKQAKKYYLMATELGHVQSQMKLAMMYYEGKGVPEIPIYAAKYFSMAAKQGNAEAQEWVAYMYYQGEGVTQNYEKALEYYRMAASAGRASALYNLARMYQMGHGTHKDIERAVDYYRLAASRGYKMAEQVLKELER